ncbi:retrovirus-related pol polyprotein from transposon TNT 1-94 [Tanacetum coccineum]
MYHSRRIRYFPRLRQDQDHCLTLMSMPYPHLGIRRIRCFGQHSKEAQSTANTPYPEDPICRIQWQLMNIPEYNNRKYAFKDVQANVENIRDNVEMNWQKCKLDWQNPITHDIKLLLHDLLIPVAHNALKNVRIFEQAIKEDMLKDLKYVKSVEKEVDNLKMEIDNLKTQLKTEKADFPKFENDQFAPILGYGDLVHGNVTINKGNDLLTGTRGSDLYIISLQESSSPTSFCFIVKASTTQAWLWNRRLSRLDFDTINLLLKNDIVNGLPKLKFVKDHLCSSCEMVSKEDRA